jgi:iron complex transport system ATP-binding protein
MEASHLTDKPMDEMSTGEARRVLIARALAPDPPALLLDEPTAGLDIVARRRFLDTLRGLARGGKTIILVTHHVEEIIPEIGRVVLLRDGRIVRDRQKDDVLTSPVLSEVFGASLRVEVGSEGYATVSFSL